MRHSDKNGQYQLLLTSLFAGRSNSKKFDAFLLTLNVILALFFALGKSRHWLFDTNRDFIYATEHYPLLF